MKNSVLDNVAIFWSRAHKTIGECENVAQWKEVMKTHEHLLAGSDDANHIKENSYEDMWNDYWECSMQFEDVDMLTLEMEHFDDLKAQQGYETSWSMYQGIMPLDQQIFSNKPRMVTYKVISEMGECLADVKWETFTCMAKDGTLGGLWAAAESCFKQARIALGDWHHYIEDFEVQEDGSLELVTGS